MNGSTAPRRFAIPTFHVNARTIRGTLIGGALPALAGALLLAGCGSGGSSATAAAGSATSTAGLSTFETCLKQRGVTVTGTAAAAVLSKLRSSTGKTATAFHTGQVLFQPATTPTPTASS